MNSAAVVSAPPAANGVNYVSFDLAGSVSISHYKSFINVGTGTIGFGIYDSTCTLVSGTTATVAAPGNASVKASMASPVTLAAGQYFVAWTSTVATDRIYGAVGDYYGSVMNAGEGASTSLAFAGSNASASGVVPATCGTRTANIGSFPPAHIWGGR